MRRKSKCFHLSFFQMRSIHSAFNHNFSCKFFFTVLILKWSALDNELHCWTTFQKWKLDGCWNKNKKWGNSKKKTVQWVHVARKKYAHSECTVLFEFYSFFLLSLSKKYEMSDWKRQTHRVFVWLEANLRCFCSDAHKPPVSNAILSLIHIMFL